MAKNKNKLSQLPFSKMVKNKPTIVDIEDPLGNVIQLPRCRSLTFIESQLYQRLTKKVSAKDYELSIFEYKWFSLI